MTAETHQFETDSPYQGEKEVTFSEVINDEKRRVIDLSIRGGATLKRHHADQPITVLCLAGTCRFLYGSELESVCEMRPGTLIALDTAIEHEVQALSDVRLVVTKFK